MFAFAIADRARRELFAARDRFGEKPFFFTEDRRGVSFASELKVLSALPDRPREVDEASLAAFLCLNYVPGERTMLAGVTRLAPGTWRLWTADGEVKAGVYWRPPNPRDAAGRLCDCPRPSIGSMRCSRRPAGSRCEATFPSGCFFPAGSIRRSWPGAPRARAASTRAFCLTFAEASYSEWPKAERTARQIGVPLHEVRLTADSLADFLPIVAHADDPLADSSALAVWTLSREAARHVKVVSAAMAATSSSAAT